MPHFPDRSLIVCVSLMVRNKYKKLQQTEEKMSNIIIVKRELTWEMSTKDKYDDEIVRHILNLREGKDLFNDKVYIDISQFCSFFALYSTTPQL